MILYITSVHDGAAAAYLPPVCMRGKNEAKRSFIAACAQEGSQFSQFAKDYSLVCLGTFDDNTGLVEACIPEVLMTGLQAKAETSVDAVMPLEAV